MKWATKLPIKKKKKEEKRAREKDRNRLAKEVQILAFAHA